MKSVRDGLIDDIARELDDLLRQEESKAAAERDFLLAVYRGRSSGLSLDDTTSRAAQLYLDGTLSEFIPIERDLTE